MREIREIEAIEVRYYNGILLTTLEAMIAQFLYADGEHTPLELAQGVGEWTDEDLLPDEILRACEMLVLAGIAVATPQGFDFREEAAGWGEEMNENLMTGIESILAPVESCGPKPVVGFGRGA